MRRLWRWLFRKWEDPDPDLCYCNHNHHGKDECPLCDCSQLDPDPFGDFQ